MQFRSYLRRLIGVVTLTATILFGCEEAPSIPATERSTPQTERPSRLLHPDKPIQSIQLVTPAAGLQEPVDFLNRPMVLQSFESTSEALAVWRQFAGRQPVLLLLANNPHLMPVPGSLREQVDTLVNNDTAAAIVAAGDSNSPNPLLRSGMAVDIALRNKWFSQFQWALPLRDPGQALDLEAFRGQLTGAGIATDEEVAGLTLDERTFRGHLRNLPFTAAALPQLQNLPQPVIVHIDLGYFQPLYKNEIATPMLGIIHDTLATLRKMHLDTLAVTFTYSHGDGQMTLDVRFLGELIKELVAQPEILDVGIPPLWARQGDALYLSNFFQKEKIRELHEAQEQEAPQAAWVKFNLFRSAAEHKEGSRALDYLAQAVALDPMYALEYLELSQLAYKRQRPDEAMRMLSLAAKALPNDPFITLQMAQLAQELGDKETALHLVDQLRALTWSQVYYPGVVENLEGFRDFLRGESDSAPTAVMDKNEEKKRSRRLHSEKTN